MTDPRWKPWERGTEEASQNQLLWWWQQAPQLLGENFVPWGDELVKHTREQVSDATTPRCVGLIHSGCVCGI